jgi:hypothetical protein
MSARFLGWYGTVPIWEVDDIDEPTPFPPPVKTPENTLSDNWPRKEYE